MASTTESKPYFSEPGAIGITWQGDNRILIVDDEESGCRLSATCLEGKYSCMTAQNAEEALVRLACEPFALVISDTQMSSPMRALQSSQRRV